MLEQKHRIKKERDIKQAFFSKFQKTTKFSRIILKRRNGDFGLIVVVSKKIYKQAVKRNRVRHKIIAIFEDLKFKGQLPINTTLAIQVKSKDILFLKKTDLEKDILPVVSQLYARSQEHNKPK